MEWMEILTGLALALLASVCVYTHSVLWLRPQRLREKLRKQGIQGPRPSILTGNVWEIKTIQSKAAVSSTERHGRLTDDYAALLYPYLEFWRKQYGPIFTYATGTVQHLYISEPHLVKEISLCRSWDLGKPVYLVKQFWPLLGLGITRSNGQLWAHQRKIIAPEFFMDKVKGMVGLMIESALPLLKSWEDRVEGDGGIADIRIDEDLRNLSADVISKACFGSSYCYGKEIFSLIWALERTVSFAGVLNKIPAFRCLPTKNTREAWRLEEEIKELILKVATKRKEESNYVTSCETEKDLLQMILEAACADQLDQETANRFVVDNCKNIYLAGHETVASVATWTLMLLASHPEWQSRARTEVFDVSGGGLPDADLLFKMKTLTMVIQETLRLFPPTSFVSREAFEEMQLGGFRIPKGVNIWIPIPTLHRIPEIWGPDSDEFKPERFAHGIFGACKLPQVFIPFGLGPRTCLGQKFAMAELKTVLSLLLSKFSFSLSPKYVHSPSFKMVLEPQYGMNLLVSRRSKAGP
ncbi:PREDICTED: cytochrome P450 714C2-like [Nelumbo nucifera]|uniref:Cytochrome P450 714C2-like n=2 Tax=Nelumbo nucifera TaxID=4432 RepID=A0A1U7ZA80_NELNU|nr:PREDICTED: cytochrome P450 714C2-like [Nelumbo nucifera]XP_010249511.1 PREDICTED: cytochrome P450 714C2-like [Nelumbo nucifera]DAD44602.1 TPA_asm: hypothetical protein HUJ06_002832 [Nelumbo nucifera]